MIINHNLNAMNAHRQMSINTNNSGKSMEKLSSGLRINRAGDDAAGLAISEKMRGQIRGLDQASRNAQDGISLLQTAEGALSETHSILQRMRELAVQSSNDTTTIEDRGNIQKEINQLTDEINRIGNSTEFNTTKLINGNLSATTPESAKIVGSQLSDTIEIRNTASASTATGSALTGNVTIHSGTGGTASFDKDIASVISGAGLTIDGTCNEITLKVNGNEYTVALSTATTTGTYDNSGATKTAAQFAADIQTDINAATGANDDVTVSITGDGKLLFTAKDTKGDASTVQVTGGNFLSLVTSAGTTANITHTAGANANNQLTIKMDTDGNGAADVNKTITLADGTYDINTLKTQLNTKITADATLNGKVTAEIDGSSIQFKSVGTGSNVSIMEVSGSSKNYLGFSIGSFKAGQDQNNEFQVKVNGETKEITLDNGTYTDKDVLAAILQTKLNGVLSAENHVTVRNSNGNLLIESEKQGSTASIEIVNKTGSDSQNIAASKSLGFGGGQASNTADTGSAGSDKSAQMHIGANKEQKLGIAINDMRAAALGITNTQSTTDAISDINGAALDVTYSGTNTVTNGSTKEYVIQVTTQESAEKAIGVLDDAISRVSTERATLGAYQNRLEHTIANLGTSSENLTSAESRIRDVDMAKEMMNFSKNNILSQAAQAMLAQANQQPQGVLQLLR